MEAFGIGEIIRDARLRHGMTQEELSFGICSVSTLSKIETGSRMPYLHTFEALMNRMGESVALYRSICGETDLKRRKLQRQMEAQLRIGNIAQVRGLLRKYQEMGVKKTSYEVQVCRMIENGLALKMGKNEELAVIYATTLELMRAAHPEFDGSGRMEACYSDSELLIFQMLASCEHKMKRYERARQTLCWLAAYQEAHADYREYPEEFIPSLYRQMSELYFEMGLYADSAEYCTRGILQSLFSGRSACFPELLMQKIRLYAEAGDVSDGGRQQVILQESKNG